MTRKPNPAMPITSEPMSTITNFVTDETSLRILATRAAALSSAILSKSFSAAFVATSAAASEPFTTKVASACAKAATRSNTFLD